MITENIIKKSYNSNTEYNYIKSKEMQNITEIETKKWENNNEDKSDQGYSVKETKGRNEGKALTKGKKKPEEKRKISVDWVNTKPSSNKIKTNATIKTTQG